MVLPLPFQSPVRPPKQYLPAEICAQLSELDEIAEYFCDRVNTASAEDDCGGYQITDTKEWDVFESAVFRVGELRADTAETCHPYDACWCEDHAHLLQASQKLTRLPAVNKNDDILMAGYYGLPAEVSISEIAVIYQSLTKLTNQIIDALSTVSLSRASRQSPAP